VPPLVRRGIPVSVHPLSTLPPPTERKIRVPRGFPVPDPGRLGVAISLLSPAARAILHGIGEKTRSVFAAGVLRG
jgi:hypothetical protein